MKIKKTTQKEEITEIEIDTPAWYKLTVFQGLDYYQIYSEEDITEVKIHENYTTINRNPLRYMYKPEVMLDGELITEQEFNEALQNALYKVVNNTDTRINVTFINAEFQALAKLI